MGTKLWMVVVLGCSGLLAACDKQGGADAEADASVSATRVDAAAIDSQKTAPSTSASQPASSAIQTAAPASGSPSATPATSAVDAGNKAAVADAGKR